VGSQLGVVGGGGEVVQQRAVQLAANLRGIGEFIGPVAKLGARVFLGPGAVVADAVIDAVAGASRGAAEIVDGGEVSYRKRKDEAARVLRELGGGAEPRRVVVLIDDVDRAAPPEMLAMLKLVKLVADLPNVSYVIALDKDRVSRALSGTLATGDGSDYLEKIIQVGVSLPPFPRDRLARLVVEQAQEVAKAAGLDTTTLDVDWSGWDGLREGGYIGIARRAVRTPRDVTRLLNAFRFAALSSDSRADVHPADLLLLCALQVRFLEVYHAVRDNRRFFLHEEWSHMIARAGRRSESADTARAERQSRLTALLTKAGQQDADTAEARQFAESTPTQRTVGGGTPSLALEIVLALFPDCIEAKQNEHESPRLRREARIASPDHFDGYFRLDPPPGVLKRAEIQAVFDELCLETFDDDQAQAMAVMAAGLSEDLRASLQQGLSDAAGGLSRPAALVVLKSLPVLARARAVDGAGGQADTSFPGESIGILVLRAAAEARQTSDPAARAAVIDRVLEVLEALRDDDSAELANDLSYRPPRSLDLTEAEVQRIAAAGLSPAENVVRSRFADPGAVRAAGREFSHDLWRWRRLAEISSATAEGQEYPPIQEFLTGLLAGDSLAVAEVIALAAGWGGDPDTPGLDMYSPMERHQSLVRVMNPSEVLQVAEAVIARGDLQHTTWPHLLEAFVDSERQVLAALSDTPRSTQPPSSSHR